MSLSFSLKPSKVIAFLFKLGKLTENPLSKLMCVFQIYARHNGLLNVVFCFIIFQLVYKLLNHIINKKVRSLHGVNPISE